MVLTRHLFPMLIAPAAARPGQVAENVKVPVYFAVRAGLCPALMRAEAAGRSRTAEESELQLDHGSAQRYRY